MQLLRPRLKSIRLLALDYWKMRTGLASHMNSEKQVFQVGVEIELPLIYDGVRLDVGYRIDLLVNDLVVVELKAVDSLEPIHQAQLLCYMKLSKKKLGLLINFNVLHLRDGIKRMVDGTGWDKP